MRIILINPEAPVNRKEFKGFLGEPLGLLYIASVLEQQGHEVKVLDMQMNPDLNLIEEIGNYGPRIIGITSVTANFHKAQQIAKSIRHNFSLFIVLGGVHATFTYHELSQHPEFDAYIIGEGEYTMLELINAIENNIGLSNIKGLAYTIEGNIYYNKQRPLVDNLDTIPFPARHLINMDQYTSHKGSALLISTRGCPYSCIFCSTSKLHGNRYRVRSVDNVIREIGLILEEYAPKSLSFADDNFTFNRLRVKNLCDAILAHGYDTPWSCSARVDNVDEELLNIMKNSGCDEIFFGIESGSQDILNTAKKGFQIKYAENALKLAKKFNIKTVASFILGLPTENNRTIRETIKFAKRIDADSYIFGFATPFPGTELQKNITELGCHVVNSDLSKYTCHYPIIESDILSSSDLQSAWIDAALQFSKKVN